VTVRTWLACCGAVLLVAASALACAGLVGITENPPGATDAAVDSTRTESGPDAATCGVVYTPPNCEACLESRCCTEGRACAGSPACGALEACLGTCAGETTCRSRCFQHHRLGGDQATPVFESCLVRECASSCGLECGGAGEFAVPDAAAACQSCFLSLACPTLETCISDPACAKAFFCTSEALTPNESLDCTRNFDAGSVAAAAGFCASACDVTSNYACVGHVTWPVGTSDDFTLLVSVGDGVHMGKVVPGVTVKVCASLDVPCAAPVAQGVTGDDGMVKLVQHRDAGPIVATGYLDLSSDGGIIPQLYFWSFPFSQSPASLFALTVTMPEATAVAASLGVTQDSSKGAVLVGSRDCIQTYAAGLTFAITPKASDTRIFYRDMNSFSPTLTETTSTGGGFAIIYNVPSGAATLTAKVAGGPIIGQFPLYVRGGGITEVLALPAPK